MTPGRGIVGWVSENGKPLLIADAHEDDRFFAEVDKSTGFDTRTVMCVPLKRGGRTTGALELLNKEGERLFNENDLHVCYTLASQAAVAIENTELATQKEEAFLATVGALATALEFRDTATEGHSRRVRDYTVALAREMGVQGDQLKTIGTGALLHDIGTIGVPDGILRKPGPLTEQERKEMQEHVHHGGRILERIPFLAEAADLPLHHHEWWNGTGYPSGLRAEEISVGCRAFAVADTLDAITSDRPCRKGRSLSVAREEIRKGAGTQFDPQAVEAFDRLPDEVLEAVRRRLSGRRRSPADIAEQARRGTTSETVRQTEFPQRSDVLVEH